MNSPDTPASANNASNGTDKRLGKLGDILQAPPRRRLRVPGAAPGEQGATPPAAAESAAAPHVEAVPDLPSTPEKLASTDQGYTPTPRPATSPRRVHATEATRARVVVRITHDLHTRLATKAARERISQGAVTLAAIEGAHQDKVLSQLLAPAITTARAGSLFTPPPVREMAEARVTIELRISRQDLATVDRLVDDYAAENRTQLITAALTYHLEPGPEPSDRG